MPATQPKRDVGSEGPRGPLRAAARSARCLQTALAIVVASHGGGAAAQALDVFAASSLTESFAELAALFEDEHPEVVVRLNLAGSAILALQVIEGAPADVFASADLRQLARVAAAGLTTGEPRPFASNRLVVVTAEGSGVRDFADLADAGLVLVLAGPSVPAGHYARQAIASADAALGGGFAARVLANVASEEQNVRLVAAKVALGEADAGIVYATDAAVFPELLTLPVPSEHDPAAAYAITIVRGTTQPALAQAFVDLVTSRAGAAVLASHGFGPAPSP